MNLEKAFIFDMDGVIVDSNPFHKIALKAFCSKHGHDLTEDELIEKIYGRRNEDWLTYIFGPLDSERLQALADEKETLFRKLYDKDIKPLDGLPAFLEALDRQKIRRVIATSAPRDNVDFTLAKTGLGKYFDVILDGADVTHGKPHPEVYLKAAAAIEFKPADCVVFEDSLAGTESGRNAGCRVVGVSTTHSKEELSQADLVIADFAGLDPRELIFNLFEAPNEAQKRSK